VFCHFNCPPHTNAPLSIFLAVAASWRFDLSFNGIQRVSEPLDVR